MRAKHPCDAIRVDLSARLDQEVDEETSARLDDHLATCAACRGYEDSLRSVKRAIALQAAPAVRDLAPAVITRITREAVGRRRERRSLLRTAVAAAAMTALVLSGSVLPWRSEPSDIAAAAAITRAVRGAATDIGSYRAEFDIAERGWNPNVPERRFTAEILFQAPESLRLEIRDLTVYPGPRWPTNDAALISGPNIWWLRETATCPAPALPGCSVSPSPEIRVLEARQPFDGTAALPTDLILPLETLADDDGLTVVGREPVGGRDAHHVVLQQWQAAPLIDSLQFAGTWREFPPTARVDLWLDSETWFPLRFTVRSGAGELTVDTTSLEQPRDLDVSAFVPPAGGDARDGGFRSRAAGPHPLPAYLGGLAPYRDGVTRDGQTVDTYVDGMSWLKVLTDRAAQPSLATFTSELVALGSGSFGYFEPSSDSLRRTLEIIGRQRRVRLETNLSRTELLRIAASVPIAGRAFQHLETPNGSIDRIDRDELSSSGYALEPTYLPEGFRFSSAFVSRTSDGGKQLSAHYRRSESGPSLGQIRITQASAVSVLTPTSEDLDSVRVAGTVGRWSAVRSELEWLDGSTYRAVAVPGFDLATAVHIAQGMQE